MSDLNKLTIADARDGLRKGDFTSQELTQSCLTAIDAADALNAVSAKTPDIAMDMAKAADERLGKGDAPAMCGIPLGIKDLFCTRHTPSQAASKMLSGFLRVAHLVAPQPLSPLTFSLLQPAPIQAAQSASPLRSQVSLVSNPPMGAVRAGASLPLPLRSIRQAP